MIRSIVYNIILLVLILLRTNGYCAEQNPEQFVREFYQWYFKADAGSTPAEHNDEIYTYVEKELVDNIRKNMSGVYYFTKVGSYSSDWENVQTIIHKSINIGNNLLVMHVTFDIKLSKHDVIIILNNEKGKFYISSVIDVYPDIL